MPSFGGLDAELLVVGLAPGLKGANASGRPFTGDFAGEVLYAGLAAEGFASGTYGARADDGFQLRRVRITNAVRCVPPANKPTPAEEKACNPFLVEEIGAMPNLKAILSLGLTSHQAVLKTFRLRIKDYPFAHAATHRLPNGILLFDSYHTSRYNISTRRLTQAMFNAVVVQVGKQLAE